MDVIRTIVGPMDGSMNHHVVDPIANCLDFAFSKSILVFGSHS